MQRCLQHIESSSWSINNKKLNYDALNPYEIFQNNLNALGYMGVDSSADSLNPAIVSLLHYYKYFGCCVQSLELIDKSSFYISGLSSAGFLSPSLISWGASCYVSLLLVFLSGFSASSYPYWVWHLSVTKFAKRSHPVVLFPSS